MAQLRQEYELLKTLNIEVFVIGPEKPQSFIKYWEKEKLLFVGLPDPKHSVLNLYDQEVSLLKLGRMPAQMLIDTHGILKFVYHGHSMADIPNIKQIKSVLSA